MAAGDESFTNIAGLQIERLDAVELRRGTVLAGRYQIETVLGQGGAGLVLRAFDRELREVVAIKVLRPEFGSATRWIERLAREVKLARQIRHPNVCRVFDFEKADGHYFIVMELAGGGTLRREIEDGEKATRPLDARIADAKAVAAGLAAIHAAGIAHRDVTPQNVLRMDDGRLVVSDFGLATEVSQTTTSLHGGTLAYMAPEVVRGERASFASDVWSLGVVIHEIVFGGRPAWSKPFGGAVLTPPLGRTLTAQERLALEVCRACTTDLPERRPKSAAGVATLLERGRVRRALHPRAWQVALAFGMIVALGALGRSALVKRASSSRDNRDLVEVPAAPADWTHVGRVLATTPDRIECLDVLPGGHAARFVWGQPRRAEDIDLRTGARTPSPIVREAYREGCPQLSPDGKRLVYEGYSPDGRPIAYLAEHPDGRDAVPMVAITDPSMSSQPKWSPDGRSFTFDLDHQRMGLFSLDTRRTTVLPEATTSPYVSSMRFVVGSRLFIAALVTTPHQTEFLELGLPFLTERGRVNVPGLALDLVGRGDQVLMTSAGLKAAGQLWKLDLARRTREVVAAIPGGVIRYPAFIDGGLLYASISSKRDVWIRGADANLRKVTDWGDVVGAAPCAEDLIVSRSGGGVTSLLRIDRTGRVLRTLSSNAVEIDPSCSPDGREWFVSRWTEPTGAYRCNERGCERLAQEAVAGLAVSPDGKRLAFVQPRKTEPVVNWMPAGGGPAREVSATETACDPGWSSSHELWVSRKRAGHLSWAEIDVDTGRETGREIAGQKDCSDGGRDPASPVDPDVRVLRASSTEIRVTPESALPAADGLRN